MKRILPLLVLNALVGLSAHADILAQWNFNNATAQATPSMGAGTLGPIGGITVSAAASGVGSSDPETATGADNALQTTKYPAADAADRTAGIEVAVSTAGYKDIAFSFDFRGSGTASRKWAVLYSLDGVNFVEGAVPEILVGSAFTNGITLNLSGIAGANDNPLFKVRVVSTFNDGTSYAGIASTYGTSGTARFDMVTVSGDTLGGLPVAPTIFASPQSRTNLVGSTATLTVVATGTQPLTFTWEKEAAPDVWQAVAGATSATLTLPNVQLTASGNYRARVSNDQGSATSEPATLTVKEDPSNTVRTIASLRAEVDLLNNDNNVDTTSLFLVEGVVTSHANLTTTAGARLFYFQDATAGIAAFWRNATVELKAGDKVRVKAPLTFFNGLLEFSPNSSTAGHEVTLLSSGNPLPTPKPFDFSLLDAANFAGIEADEGRLVVVENVSLDAGGDLAFRSKSSGYPVTPAAGSTAQPFTMFVNSGTDIVNQAIPAGPFTIIGVLGQFDSSNPRDSGYQVIPTRYVDVQTASKPPSIRFTNSLANLVRPGDAVTNSFAEHALRPGESITIGFAITDPDGRPVTVTLGNGIPAGGAWNFASTTGTQVNGQFTYTATPAAAGNAYPVSVTADNGVATFTQTIRLYVPTAAEQQVVITEFYANPGTNGVAWFNPLNRSELLPGGNDASPANRDEFVELVNLSGETIDLTGWMLSDALLRRAYIYPGTPGTSLAPSNSVIVYGGPTIGYTPQLAVPTIAAEVGPGDAFSTAGLALNNDGDTIVLRNAASNIVARVVYTGGQTSTNSSLTRFPTDRDGFVAHRSTGELYWSPGNQANGQAWTEGQPNADVGPAITTMPVSLSVAAGNPATFSVVATGVPAPTYRWMRGGVVLLGETAASYTLASPLLTDDGAIFQVIVENRVGSITSAPVTLTVTAPPPEIIKTNIAYLRTQVDPVNLRPGNTTQLYEIEGTVTTHVNLTGSANCFFYLQDDTAGVSAFVTGKPGTEVPPAGARVRLVGPLGHFNGLLELNLAATNAKHIVEVLSTGNPLPAPVPVDYAWPTATTDITASSPGVAAAEAKEGRLVRLDNVLLDTASGANFTSGSNVTVTNAANPADVFILRIDSRVTEIIGQPKPTTAVSLVGVLGQFDSADPRAGGYQLIVTRLADIIASSSEPIAATATVTGESITLNWTGSVGATYSVLRGTNVVGTLETIATGLTVPSFTEAFSGRAAGFYRITSP